MDNELKGSKRVEIAGSEDKRQITALLCGKPITVECLSCRLRFLHHAVKVFWGHFHSCASSPFYKIYSVKKGFCPIVIGPPFSLMRFLSSTYNRSGQCHCYCCCNECSSWRLLMPLGFAQNYQTVIEELVHTFSIQLLHFLSMPMS